jgi:DNA-binding transcriptional regulator YiaG
MALDNYVVDDLVAKLAARELPSPEECERIRLEAHASTSEVAEAVGTTRVSIRNWEKGKCRPLPHHAAVYAVVMRRLARFVAQKVAA